MGKLPEFWARRLAVDPLIFLAPTSEDRPIGPIELVARMAPGRRVHALVTLYWTCENPAFFERTVAAYLRHASAFPRNRVTFLCNTAREVELFTAAGLDATLCNHNIFVDDKVFHIDAGQPKEFDAIYVGVLRKYKRHELCRNIPSVALVYYDRHRRTSAGYFEELKAKLPNATFINEVYAQRGYARPAHARAQALIDAVLAQHGHVNLSPASVAACMNRSAVGLCLSREEGAMAASIEYLLCGLPVVSTTNTGGRDFFFESDYCATVDADAASVAKAAADLSRRAPPGEVIRGRTLDTVRRERHRFRTLLGTILEAEGCADGMAATLDGMFTGPLWQRWTVDTLLGR